MSNEEIIWNFLFDKLKNPYGAAAMMGNLFAESSFNPINANGVKRLGLTNLQYTQIVDENKNNNFITDGIAYGLAQWCYKTRKQGLLDQARKENKSIGDINLQLDYIWSELQLYKTVLRALQNATEIRTVSDIVMLKYERPANTSEKMKIKRAGFGQKYFNKYGAEIVAKNNIRHMITINENFADELYEQLKRKLK